MQNIDLIQKSLDYIEENLKSEFQVEDLAKDAGYSLFHYYRVFQKLVGLPVMQYINRRKLLYAAYEIAKGEKVIDVALSYGFETNAGFYKAFKREFGCAPFEYVTRHAARRPYKINLIQEEHIMLNSKKIKEVLVFWGMQEEAVTDFYYAGTGQRSDCEWNVGENHVIKVGTNVAGLEKSIEISRALADHGFGVSLPVKTTEGKDYYWDGELYFCVETKLNGQPVKSGSLYDEETNFSPRYLGEIIGQLDLMLAKFGDKFVCNEPNLLETAKYWSVPKVKEMTDLPAEFFEDYLEVFSAVYESLPRQMIHRNPCLNFLVGEQEQIAGITDFELSEKNVRIFDPCYMATSILSENFEKNVQQPEKWFEIFREILTGYDAVVKLTDEEKKAIPYVVYSIQFTCIAWFGEREKFKELADTNVAMLEWLVENKEKLSVFA